MHLTGINKVDIDRIVISNKDWHCKKGSFQYFLGYINNYIRSLYIKLF